MIIPSAFLGRFRRALLAACLLLPGSAVLTQLAAAESTITESQTARPFVSPIFGDFMVLQRGRPNPIWGWTHPGENIRVEIGAVHAEAVADANGRWEASIEPPPVGSEYSVTISGSQRVELRHVLSGDVWFCGGQSNMEFGLPGARDGAKEVAAANQPQIRFFKVAPHPTYGPTDTVAGEWRVCTPETAGARGGISAVAYYFARRLSQDVDVPIGLVQDALGGTPAEAWMSPATLAARGDFAAPLAEVERLRAEHAPEYGNYIMHWYDRYDPGAAGQTWANGDFADPAWKPVTVPGAFDRLGLAGVPAVVWLTREIDLPDPLPPGAATLNLGVVEKMDTSYVNGHWVGASAWVENPRAYRIPAGVLQPGRNRITLRIFKVKSEESFLSPAAQLRLSFAGGPEYPLAGEGWSGRIAVDARPPRPLPLGFENWPTMPTVLYQGMLAPVAPLALKGVLWYQGEANASRAHQYRSLLPELIADWRKLFRAPDLPFLIAGLPAFQARRERPGSDDWAELREAQALTAAAVPHAAVAVTVDTGEADNIHPKEKQPVGDRLALLALTDVYGRDVVSRGPVFRSAKRTGAAMRVEFDHVADGLRVQGDTLAEFSVAGANRRWYWATAKLDGNAVVVSAPEVPEPVAVRYAWQSNPRATLCNSAGLPAAPFRSDDWPGITEGRKPW